ncbi:MAG: hypothetical protein Q8O03_06660 [Nanoarchaeota archaeon]|nr:hypothetical protein [Nanoarchaeota archaeon]
MADKDFSRIGEIFYRMVGEGEQVSLESFIKKALTVYSQKYLAEGVFEASPKRITFPSSRGSLSLVVRPYHSQPDVSSLGITGKTCDVSNLMGMLIGDVTSEFLGLDFETVDEGLRKKVLKAKKKGYANAGNAGFYFSLDPKTPELLKKLDWKRIKSESFDNEVFYTCEEDKDLMNLIVKADSISIKYNFYIDNNPTMGIIKESCEIKQPCSKDYRFVYSISAVEKTLPASIIKHLEDVFEIVKQDFDHLSHQRMKIEDVNNIFIGAYS